MPLRLKALELHGYKTFAGQTLFEFADGITAIVGPNGAGKSNIADALRWVLGEQSYGLLRGKKTEDMIFSGSEHRPRAGMASVEIMLDNASGWLPIEFSEVAVARRAYRDGHNEYVLNGQHVRLRDMNELLAGAGLSERTYTIVGQGLVDASLALKADERRRLFEEAAGVGLYRVRREESLRRLENTRRNVERVQDIMGEIEPRLKTLERQARRAREYAAAQEDLRVVLREWYGFHWHQSQKDLVGATKSARTMEAATAAAGAELHEVQEQHGKLRERLGQLRSQVNEGRQIAARLQQEQQATGLELAVLAERRRSLADAQVVLAGEKRAVEAEAELNKQRLTSIEEDLGRAELELAEARTRRSAAEKELEARQSQRVSLQTAAESALDQAAELQAQLAQTRARLDVIEVNAEGSRKRMAAVETAERAARDALRQAEENSVAVQEERQQAEHQLDEVQARYDRAKADLGREIQARDGKAEERKTLASSQARAQAQLEVIDRAEQTMTGFADGARFLMEAARQNRLKARGALSAMLELPVELETAIAAALGDAIDAVLIEPEEIDRALELLEAPDAGRAVLLPLNGNSAHGFPPPSDSDLVGVASKLVEGPPELRPVVNLLLSNTLVVRSRVTARRLLPQIPAHGRIVTLQGEVFRGDGSIAAGRMTTSSALSRPRQRRELGELLLSLESRAKALDSEIEQAGASIETGQHQLEDVEAAVEAARRDVVLKRSAEEKAAADVTVQRRAVEWQEALHMDLAHEQSRASQEKPDLTAQTATLEEKIGAARRELGRLRGEMDETGLEELRAETAYWTTRAAVSDQALESIQSRRAELQAAIDGANARIHEVSSREAEIGQSLASLEADKDTHAARERELAANIMELQSRIDPAQSELQAAEAREAELEVGEADKQGALSAAERNLAQAQIELVRRQETLDSLRDRIMDDFGLVSLEYASNVEGPVPLPFEGLVEDLKPVEYLSPETEELLAQRRARLRRLGLVNPEAAREYETESERYSFMSAQIRDLRQAEQDLREVIAELDELTRQAFSKTYSEVDRQFRAIFARLFGGGTAHLELTDPDNLVDTGIEIEARLPGRREQGLSLLSGGERSLTAIALVFALLKVSPTPLCVMDEVDAMLDEANVGRFRDLLRELSQETQFIIITHNRNTVQAADFIYGVTMGRDSTSQVISLKLDEISEEMLGSSRA
jgi:chromosome segregation protein